MNRSIVWWMLGASSVGESARPIGFRNHHLLKLIAGLTDDEWNQTLTLGLSKPLSTFTGSSSVSLLGLIFIFTAKIGTVAGIGSIFIAVPMTIFIYVLKILVSAIQAYIFTMLSALYIGLAVEEHHHEEHHEADAGEHALAGA